MNSILNWRTTGLGLLAGILNLVASGMTWKAAALSVLFATWGAAQKDGATGSAPGSR
jgi:hypothetical protein